MEKTYGNFELIKDGITLYVNWDKKNYQVSSTIGGIQFSEYSHMMFMCPRFFTEEDVRKKCVALIPISFLHTESLRKTRIILAKRKQVSCK